MSELGRSCRVPAMCRLDCTMCGAGAPPFETKSSPETGLPDRLTILYFFFTG